MTKDFFILRHSNFGSVVVNKSDVEKIMTFKKEDGVEIKIEYDDLVPTLISRIKKIRKGNHFSSFRLSDYVYANNRKIDGLRIKKSKFQKALVHIITELNQNMTSII